MLAQVGAETGRNS